MTSPLPPSSQTAETDQLLEMTVYPLPGADNRPPMSVEQARKGQQKMLWLMALCSAPVLIAYFLFYVVRPGGQGGFGVLIDPAHPMPALHATSLTGDMVPLQSLKGQWLLVNVAAGDCQSACEQRLLTARQIRESMGKDKERIDRVWLVSDQAPVPAALLPTLKDSTILRMAAADISKWVAVEPGKQLQDHLYLVDPLGNWMMRFPSDLSLKEAPKVRKDLDRLLKATMSWDGPGRNTP